MEERIVKMKKILSAYEKPQCELLMIRIEENFTYSPNSPGTALPGYGDQAIGNYDEDNPYFGS